MLSTALKFLLGLSLMMLTAMIMLAGYNISKASSLDFSISPDYRIEYVPVTLPYTYVNYAYIRITEVAHPERVYRTPIVVASDVDLRGVESSTKN